MAIPAAQTAPMRVSICCLARSSSAPIPSAVATVNPVAPRSGSIPRK